MDDCAGEQTDRHRRHGIQAQGGAEEQRADHLRSDQHPTERPERQRHVRREHRQHRDEHQRHEVDHAPQPVR
jgi:hypothetical protein